MFTIYNDNVLLLSMHTYTLNNNIIYSKKILIMLLICDKDPYVSLLCLYYVMFLSPILFCSIYLYAALISACILTMI